MLHKKVLPGNIHGMVNWEIADATALSALTLIPEDKWKLAYQIDIGAIKLLTNDSPATWQTIAQIGVSYQPLDTQLTAISSLSYTGNALTVIRVKADESGFELATVSGGVTDHALLSNIGTRTHAQLESDIASLASATTTALSGKQDKDTQLTDLAALAYSGNGLKGIRVNAAENAFEFYTPGGGGGGLVNITEAIATSSPNGSRNTVSLTVSGGSTDNDFAIVPKGQGALVSQVADSSTTGGNKRGQYAVDFQRQRNDASQVASGSYACILNGERNAAAGAYCVLWGYSNFAVGSHSFVGGEGHVLTGSHSFLVGKSHVVTSTHNLVGGEENSVSGIANIVSGLSNATASSYNALFGRNNEIVVGASNSFSYGENNFVRGEYSSAVGKFGDSYNTIGRHVTGTPGQTAQGNYQSGSLDLAYLTTDATPRVLTSNIGGAGNNNQLSIGAQRGAIGFKGQIVAKEATGSTTTNDTCYIEFSGLMHGGQASGGSAVLVGSITQTTIAASAGASTWSAAVTVDSANASLKVTVTGEGGKFIRWLCHIDSVELGD